MYRDIALEATGGVFPYKFNVTGLPAGMIHAEFMRVNGIGGTPTQSGTFSLNVSVEDSTPPPTGPCKGSRSYQLIIEPSQVGQPHFTIDKKVSYGAIEADGSFTVAFTLTIFNDGTAQGTATVDDALPGNVTIKLPGECTAQGTPPKVTCTSGLVAANSQKVFAFEVTYKALHPRTYTNTATVTTDQTGTKVQSNMTTLELNGIPKKFLQPANKPAPPANTPGRKR
jgi:hypothetical protein